MSTQFDKLCAEALKLPSDLRAQLADRLLASLVGEGEIDDAWFAEVERRIAEVENGQAALVPVEQAIARARQALA